MIGDDVAALLTPESIALVGVSHKGGASRGLLANLVDHGYPGRLHLVNPAGGAIDGRVCHPSVAALPEAPDVALVVAPAEHVAALVRECGERGVRTAVVFSAGFADDPGPAGRTRSAALAEAVASSGVRVLGPNCLGFLNLRGRVAASWSSSLRHGAVAAHTLAAPEAADHEARHDALAGATGGVAIVAQSGGLGFSLFNRGLGLGLRFSHVVSAGNEADLDVQDIVGFLLSDPGTKVILLYLEGLRDPSRFAALAAHAAALGKPLVVAKVGRSAAAARAALSHTGHLAGDDAAFDAVFSCHGVTRVHDADEMLDVGLVLSCSPPAAGRRVAVVSHSGGNAVWMADALDAHGLSSPPLSPAVRERLVAALPTFAATANPVDISGAATVAPAEVLAMVAEDPGIDALVLIATYGRTAAAEADLPALERLLAAGGKPVLVCSYTDPSAEARRLLRGVGVPTFTSTRRCARALQALADWSLHRPEPPLGPWPHGDVAQAAVAGWEPGATSVPEHRTKELLRAVGLPVTTEELATTPAEAVAAAARMGGPVALKVQSPEVAHKARLGGVALGVEGSAAVAAAFGDVTGAVRRALPGVALDGVLVQQMVAPGIEVLVGVQSTSGLGPMVLVGLGGPLAEVLDRHVLHPAPFGEATARRLLHELGLGKMVHAAGGVDPELAVEGLARLVSTVSRLAEALRHELAELDLNPVMFDPRTSLPVVVDALAVAAPRDALVGTTTWGADRG